ncbi:hypothetical protein [uncultured Roseobacter sp.]|uniref:hypothetical protein n=1 Tax=uncultured Roseobacter sp. TaxID=114847 RepID=UPI0026080596|nr:hypothetical protein [uncultured Roseobacter sp.]
MRIFPVFPILIAFAAADAASGGGDGQASPVAEIVTYRVKQGVSTDALLDAARATEPFLASTGAVLSRSLSRDDDGLWTDYILWTSLEAAKATEAKAMERSEFQTFFAMMEEESTQLRHARVLMQMD